jgi:hypothetical protein
MDAANKTENEHNSDKDRGQNQCDPKVHEAGCARIDTPPGGSAKTGETALPYRLPTIETVKKTGSEISRGYMQTREAVSSSHISVVLLPESFPVIRSNKNPHDYTNEGRKEENHR